MQNAAKTNGFLRELRKNRILFLMVLPAIVVVLIFSYIPLNGLVLAFKNFQYSDGIWGSP